MSFFTFSDIEIAGITAAVPADVVAVDSFSAQFGEAVVDKFKKATGVCAYHRCGEHQTASDLGYAAAQELFRRKSIDKDSIGVLAFVSLSPDYLRPSTACVLHKRLGLPKQCAAYDIGLGCSGFVYGLINAAAMLHASDAQQALVVFGESLTKLTHPNDRATVMLLGDGGGAVLLKKTPGCVMRGMLFSDGENYRSAIVQAGGFRNRNVSRSSFIRDDGNEGSYYHYEMDGVNIFSFSITEIPQAFRSFFNATQTAPENYDCLVLHQANAMIIKQLKSKLKLPDTVQVPVSLDRYGNTSVAALPISLCDAYGVQKGSAGLIHTLLCGFGVGLSYGIVSAELDTRNIFPVIETSDYFEEAVLDS